MLKFKNGDKVQISGGFWGPNPLSGIIIETFEDTGFYCSDITCCGEPVNHYTIELSDGSGPEIWVPEHDLELLLDKQ